MASAIELELQKASKIKPKPKEDDQTYFKRLIDTVQELPDDKWEGLTSEAQNWVNAGATAVNKKKDIETFSDDEPPAEEEPAEEEESPEDETSPARRTSSRRPAVEEEEEEEPPRRSRKAAAEEDEEPPPRRSSRKAPAAEEEEELPRRSSRKAAADEEEEEPPRRTRRAAVEEDDTETQPEEDDVKKPKGGKSAAKKPAAKVAKKAKVPGAQLTIKKLVIGNPKLTSEQIVEKLKAKDLKASASAVSTIRSGTLQTMRLIKEIGMPKGDF